MNERVARGCVAAGALLVGVAPFLTWIVVGDPFGIRTGGRNLWQWQTGAGSGPLVAVPVVLAAAVLLGALLRWRWWVRRLAVATALVAGARYALSVWFAHVYARDGWAQLRPGAWVGLLGAVLLLTGAIAMPRLTAPPRSRAWRRRRWLLAGVIVATFAIPVAVAAAERSPRPGCHATNGTSSAHYCVEFRGPIVFTTTSVHPARSIRPAQAGGAMLRPWALAGWLALALATVAVATTLSARTERA